MIGRCSTARSASGDICAAAATVLIAALRLTGSGSGIGRSSRVSIDILR
nr:MAG TPA: hypothetical protein [Caudoviricetes sp.]